MASTRFLLMLALTAVFVCFIAVAESAPAPEEEDLSGMRSALEYLQRLDKYYSQVARPRQGRERREDVASALMKLSQIREHYSDMGRPRFGKRADSAALEPAYIPSWRQH